MNERTYEGVIVRYIESGGYGFIFNDLLNRRVFFHVRNWNHGVDPTVGDGCTFRLAPSPYPGRKDQAVDVTPTGVNAYEHPRLAGAGGGA